VLFDYVEILLEDTIAELFVLVRVVGFGYLLFKKFLD